jgi:osmotically inducible protein OsmC
MITKTASAKWQGTIKEGKGSISTESNAFQDQPYGFNTRFEDKAGTNPEELIAAAHASCFTMALSKELGDRDIHPEHLETKASITMEKDDSGFTITKSHLVLEAKLPGADENTFNEAAESAKKNCPISKLLNADITLESRLES